VIESQSQHSSDSGTRADRVLAAAGVIQLVATLTPAVRVPLAHPVLFFRLPNAGVVLVMLGVVAVAIAFRPRGWWRWLPPILTSIILAVAYWRIVHAPSGTFADVVLRHTVHPAWGFFPMGIAVVTGLAGAARIRRAPTVETDAVALEIEIG
jgi:hypothetical protein